MAATTLFQVPVAMVDVFNASRIQYQRAINPGNCGAASGLLLGLVTPKEAEYLSALDLSAPSVWTHYWEHQLSKDGNQYSTVRSTFNGISNIVQDLFLGCGTLVLTRHPRHSLGHWVVIAKDMNGRVAFIDLQNGKLLTEGADVINYVADAFQVSNTNDGVGLVDLYAFKRNVAADLPGVLYFFYLYRSRALLTNDQVAEMARNNPVPSVPGGRRRRKRLTARARSRPS
jgi:hypothetical protein